MIANFFMIVQQNKNNETCAINWKKFDKWLWPCSTFYCNVLMKHVDNPVPLFYWNCDIFSMEQEMNSPLTLLRVMHLMMNLRRTKLIHVYKISAAKGHKND